MFNSKRYRRFSLENLVASYDCITNLNFNILSPSVSCNTTLFKITVTDPYYAAVNPTQTLTKSFFLHINNLPPTISTSFHTSLKTFSYHSNK